MAKARRILRHKKPRNRERLSAAPVRDPVSIGDVVRRFVGIARVILAGIKHQ